MHWNQTRRWETSHLKNDSFSLSGRCLATLAADILRSLSANQREHPTEFKFPNNINSKDHVNLSNSDRYMRSANAHNIHKTLSCQSITEREKAARPDFPFSHSTLLFLYFSWWVTNNFPHGFLNNSLSFFPWFSMTIYHIYCIGRGEIVNGTIGLLRFGFSPSKNQHKNGLKKQKQKLNLSQESWPRTHTKIKKLKF